MPRRFDDYEGPSESDLEQFAGSPDAEAFCPECGEAISELADICPKCNSWIPEGAQRRPPVVNEMIRRWYIFIALGLLVVFLYVYLF